MEAQWEAVRDRIRDELETLGLPEALVVGEPPEYGPTPHNAWWQFWRSDKPEELPTTVFVQFGQFFAGDVKCEFVGSNHTGESYQMPLSVHERLRELGWMVPDEPTYWDGEFSKKGYRCYRIHGKPENSAELARIAAESLALLVADPKTLQYERV